MALIDFIFDSSLTNFFICFCIGVGTTFVFIANVLNNRKECFRNILKDRNN